MRCTVSDENHRAIPCELKQTSANGFSIKITPTSTKRHQIDLPPERIPKRQRLDEPHSKRELRQRPEPVRADQPIV